MSKVLERGIRETFRNKDRFERGKGREKRQREKNRMKEVENTLYCPQLQRERGWKWVPPLYEN